MRIALLIFPLLVFSLLFSCSDKKPAKSDQETSVSSKDNADSVETDTMESNRNHLHVSSQKSKSLNYKFLVPAHYHYINPGRMIDSSWVEIYQKGKKFYRAKAQYTLKRRWSDYIGDTANVLYGKRKAFLFVNHLPTKLGEIEAANLNFDEYITLRPNEVCSFMFGGKRYNLEIKKEKKKDDSVPFTCFALLNGKQIAKRTKVFEAAFELLFAGDIDGDGKLDLVIDFRSDTGEFKVVLFLSSCALPGQPVQQVGEIDDQYDC